MRAASSRPCVTICSDRSTPRTSAPAQRASRPTRRRRRLQIRPRRAPAGCSRTSFARGTRVRVAKVRLVRTVPGLSAPDGAAPEGGASRGAPVSVGPQPATTATRAPSPHEDTERGPGCGIFHDTQARVGNAGGPARPLARAPRDCNRARAPVAVGSICRDGRDYRGLGPITRTNVWSGAISKPCQPGLVRFIESKYSR